MKIPYAKKEKEKEKEVTINEKGKVFCKQETPKISEKKQI
jgi:hypothetical protein